MALHIVIKNLLELSHDAIPAQGGRKFAVNINGSDRILKGTRQADAKIGVLLLPRPVYDATHHRELQLFNTGIDLPPLRH